jgi:hypothetical protein
MAPDLFFSMSRQSKATMRNGRFRNALDETAESPTDLRIMGKIREDAVSS